MNAHQMLDWLFLTGFMPLIRAALPNQNQINPSLARYFDKL